MESTLIVALTGGVAMGKSTVTERLQTLGATVLDADRISRDVVAPGTPGWAAIVARFGTTVLQADRSLDRKALRERIFRKEEERRAIEAIVHPLVHEAMHSAAMSVRQGIVVLAIPLLVESGQYDWVDRIAVVDARPTTQLARLLARDRIELELARDMIAAQAPRSKRLAIADDVITNDDTLAALHVQVDAVWMRWQALTKRR